MTHKKSQLRAFALTAFTSYLHWVFFVTVLALISVPLEVIALEIRHRASLPESAGARAPQVQGCRRSVQLDGGPGICGRFSADSGHSGLGCGDTNRHRPSHLLLHFFFLFWGSRPIENVGQPLLFQQRKEITYIYRYQDIYIYMYGCVYLRDWTYLLININ